MTQQHKSKIKLPEPLREIVDQTHIAVRLKLASSLIQGASVRKTGAQQRLFFLSLVNNMRDLIDQILEKIEIEEWDKDEEANNE